MRTNFVAIALMLALCAPAAFGQISKRDAIFVGGGAGIGAAIGGKKGAVIGAGAGAGASALYAARKEQKEGKEEAAFITKTFDQFRENKNSPLYGKTVTVIAKPLVRNNDGVIYSAYETGVAVERVRDILTYIGARSVLTPADALAIQQVMGGNSQNYQANSNVSLPPYFILVGAEQVTREKNSSRIETGIYGKEKQQEVYVGRVRIEVYHRVDETFGSFPGEIGSQDGFGKSVVGSSLAKHILGGMYSTREESTANTFDAILHGTAKGFANIRWSPLLDQNN